MDAALAGLLGGLGGGLVVGVFGYAGTRATVRAEWRKAHNDRLMDRRFDAYLEAAVFASKMSGFVVNVVRQCRGEGAWSGPDVPDDNEWSRLTASVRAFGSEPVAAKFGDLGSAVRSFSPLTLMVPGQPWIAHQVPLDRIPEIEAGAETIHTRTRELVDAINGELTTIPKPP